MQPNDIDKAADTIDWPAELGQRTPPDDRERTSKFKVTLADALSGIEKQLELLDVDDYRLSTAAPHRKRDGRPYANVNPDDPAIVVRWFDADDRYAAGADHYTTLKANARALGLYLENKRKMAMRPVATVDNEFSVAKLPPGDGDDSIVLHRDPAAILGVQPDAPKAVIEAAARQLKAAAHPDQGGDAKQMQRIEKAKVQLLTDN